MRDFACENSVKTFVHAFYHKEIEKINPFKLIYYILMFPLIDKINQYCAYIALFKHVDWKPVPHNYTVDLNAMKKD